MKRLRLTGLAALAIAIAGASSAAGQGLPTANPTNKANSMDFISLNNPKDIFANGIKIECTTSSTGTSTETGSPAGSGEYHLTLKGCVGLESGIDTKCTGLGDATTGEILVLGTYSLVYDTGGTELGVAILFSISPTHFTCAGLFLDVMSGGQLCLIKEPYTSKTLHEMVCEQSGGHAKETYLDDSGTVVGREGEAVEGESTTVASSFEWKALLLFLNAAKANVATIFVMN